MVTLYFVKKILEIIGKNLQDVRIISLCNQDVSSSNCCSSQSHCILSAVCLKLSSVIIQYQHFLESLFNIDASDYSRENT